MKLNDELTEKIINMMSRYVDDIGKSIDFIPDISAPMRYAFIIGMSLYFGAKHLYIEINEIEEERLKRLEWEKLCKDVDYYA